MGVNWEVKMNKTDYLNIPINNLALSAHKIDYNYVFVVVQDNYPKHLPLLEKEWWL